MDTLEQAVKMTEDLLPVYDELAKVAALPWREFDAEYPKFQAKAKAASPLAGALLPQMTKVMAKQRRHQVRMAMLLAAVAVVQGGPDALKDIKDRCEKTGD